MNDDARDRLRELLDAVLEGTDGAVGGERRRLADMADDAASSSFHLSRLVSAATGEPPVAMRRRVLLERAAWQLAHGASVTDTALHAGYGSPEGFGRAFARAFGRPPSSPASGSHWLPAPNGIHFHPPTSLWVRAEESPMDPLTKQLVAHDLDDTRALLDLVEGLTEEGVRARRPLGRRALVGPTATCSTPWTLVVLRETANRSQNTAASIGTPAAEL